MRATNGVLLILVLFLLFDLNSYICTRITTTPFRALSMRECSRELPRVSFAWAWPVSAQRRPACTASTGVMDRNGGQPNYRRHRWDVGSDGKRRRRANDAKSHGVLSTDHADGGCSDGKRHGKAFCSHRPTVCLGGARGEFMCPVSLYGSICLWLSSLCIEASHEKQLVSDIHQISLLFVCRRLKT